MTAPSPQAAHPLATRLARLYRDEGRTRPVLEIAAGSGRNTRALVDAGIPIVSTRDDEAYTQLPGSRDLYDAALSTHGYLHGTVAKLRIGFAELRRVLRAGSPVAITLGSIADARYGFGEALDEHTFAAGDGDEAGIPHAYFDRAGAIEVLAPFFTVDDIADVDVDEIAGRWAHPEPAGMRHWFVLARRTRG